MKRSRILLVAFLFVCGFATQSVTAGEADTLNAVAADNNAAPALRVRALLDLASYYQTSGFRRQALAQIHEAQGLALQVDPELRLIVTARAGAALVDAGSYDEAISALGHVLAETSGQATSLRASSLNAVGRAESALGNYRPALVYFEEGIAIAKSSGDKLLEARLQANKARALLGISEPTALVNTLSSLQFLVSNLPVTNDRIELLIASADLQRSAYWYFDFSSDSITTAVRNLREAITLAESTGDSRLLSYAKGSLGRLYEDEGKLDDAMTLSREAAFHANSVDAYESAYLWQWQIARLYRQQGNEALAVDNYRQAIALLEHVRQELIDGSPYTFHDKVQPLFTELADILLKSTAAMSAGAERDERLHSVQRILEQSKSAELQDYFQNECVLPETSVELSDVEKGTAVIYPVLLPDRVEVLVNLGQEIFQFTSPYQRRKLERLVNEFRDQIQVDQGDDEYLELARELYDVIVAPMASLLARNNVHTLLFVPDGELRTVPIAAFHDGEHFLIEKYAVATTPGLTLTLPRPLELRQAKLFAGGISESVQGFSGLPGVPSELNNLHNNYGAAVMRDEAFVLQAVRQQMASDDYSIVHIATHGHFDRDPQKSFLLAYDDKLTMNLLEQSIGYRKYLGEPLELLVLSACETAAGDNRAALGLAGVALKAGARSAVATLWQISDAATVQLIDQFYRSAATGTVSKAKALQAAQIALIESGRFVHPTDWAPFLLIGNWL